MLQTIGLVGALLSGVAYIPQITHLIREHCSAGISRKAYVLWLIAASAILVNAVSAGFLVFIVLGCVQVIADLLILLLASRYRGVCAFHASGGNL